ncbi:MAG: hypothetical protein IT459_16570 [Planctomycetes bacterium]|nr:hypothetical protein [Planctomycetota bacterium]
MIVVAGSIGPGIDQTSLQTAIGVAQSGDIILLKPGTYGPALIQGKSLTIAKYGDFVQVGGLIVQNLAADQRVVLRELTLTHIVVTPPPIVFLPPLQVRTCAGAVSVEGCELDYYSALGPDRAAAVVTQSECVVFSQCSLTGGEGSPTLFDPFVGGVPGGEALRVVDSKVWLHGSTCRGGDGGLAVDDEMSPTSGGDGIRAQNSWVWVFGFVGVPLVLGMLQVGPPAVLVGLGTLPANGAVEFDANAGHLPPGVDGLAATAQVHVAGQTILPASLSNPATCVIVNP